MNGGWFGQGGLSIPGTGTPVTHKSIIAGKM
jgi:hypothetical protein